MSSTIDDIRNSTSRLLLPFEDNLDLHPNHILPRYQRPMCPYDDVLIGIISIILLVLMKTLLENILLSRTVFEDKVSTYGFSVALLLSQALSFRGLRHISKCLAKTTGEKRWGILLTAVVLTAFLLFIDASIILLTEESATGNSHLQFKPKFPVVLNDSALERFGDLVPRKFYRGRNVSFCKTSMLPQSAPIRYRFQFTACANMTWLPSKRKERTMTMSSALRKYGITHVISLSGMLLIIDTYMPIRHISEPGRIAFIEFFQDPTEFPNQSSENEVDIEDFDEVTRKSISRLHKKTALRMVTFTSMNNASLTTERCRWETTQHRTEKLVENQTLELPTPLSKEGDIDGRQEFPPGSDVRRLFTSSHELSNIPSSDISIHKLLGEAVNSLVFSTRITEHPVGSSANYLGKKGSSRWDFILETRLTAGIVVFLALLFGSVVLLVLQRKFLKPSTIGALLFSILQGEKPVDDGKWPVVDLPGIDQDELDDIRAQIEEEPMDWSEIDVGF